jgi:hypothetical protein
MSQPEPTKVGITPMATMMISLSLIGEFGNYQ